MLPRTWAQFYPPTLEITNDVPFTVGRGVAVPYLLYNTKQAACPCLNFDMASVCVIRAYVRTYVCTLEIVFRDC